MLRKLLFCCAILFIAGPVAADHRTGCSRQSGDITIAGCMPAIDSAAGRPFAKYAAQGIADRARGDAKPGIADYTEAIRRNPTDASAYYNRGNAYSARGDTDRAIADGAAAGRRGPARAGAGGGRGGADS